MQSKKNFILFLISIFLLSSLIFMIKTINYKNNKYSNMIRNLLLDDAKSYLCNKAGSKLMDKYKDGFDEEMGDAKESLNEAQQTIVNSIKKFNYKNIKPYFKRITIFIIFVVFFSIFNFNILIK